jgi:hypothetical protein
MPTPFAEDVNYWKSGQSAPDTWIEKAKAEIKAAGGKFVGEAFGSEAGGRAAFMLEFEFGGERFRAVWPVLPTRAKTAASERAAKIQAATMLYHDVKARCVAAKVLGARASFFSYLMLPDGRTISQAAAPEVAQLFPRLLTSSDK